MRYDNSDEELVRFIKDPVANVDVLLKRLTQTKPFVRLLFRFPLFRKLLPVEAARALLYEHIYSVYCVAVSELRNNAPTCVPFNQDTYQNLKILSDVFDIHFKESIPDYAKKAVVAFIEKHKAAKVEYHCNRVMEVYPMSGQGAFPLRNFLNVWRLFFLSETLFLIETGQMSVNTHRSGFVVKRNEKMLTETSAYWIAETSESTSNIADKIMLSLNKQPGEMPRAISAQQLMSYVAFVMDKVFSIQADYLPSDIRRTESYRLFWDAIAFAILVDLFCLNHFGSIEKYEIHRRRLIREENLEFIDSILSSLDSLRFGDATGFVSADADRYHRGRLNFKYGIKKFVGVILHNFKEKTNESFFGLYGKSFESDFILRKIREFGGAIYTVFEGFNPRSHKSLVKNYDIDVIIHNRSKDKFYFIQVKYFASFIPTYLSEQCAFMNDRRFKRGIRQLLGLKGRLNEKSIRQILENKGLAGATNENSHFLLVHNIPFLNFYEHEGVILYEWNLLRNLLSGGSWTQFSEDNIEEGCMNIDFDFEDPLDCATRYIKGGMMKGAYEASFAFFLNSRSVLKFDNFDVTSDML